MRSVETTGKTVEEAKELAAAELGAPVEQISFEVLDEGGKGFLGKPRLAKVSASVMDDSEEPQEAPAPHVAAVEAEESLAGEPAEGLGGKTEGEWTVELLQNILQAANLDAAPRLISEADESIEIDIEGSDVAILIGKHGQTLDALQYLLGVALNRAARSRTRVTLDAEGYRDRHAQMLTAKAIEYARRVKESGEEAVLDPQSPRDRRLVHMALADDEDIYTYSEGDGDDRHVVISPRK